MGGGQWRDLLGGGPPAGVAALAIFCACCLSPGGPWPCKLSLAKVSHFQLLPASPVCFPWSRMSCRSPLCATWFLPKGAFLEHLVRSLLGAVLPTLLPPTLTPHAGTRGVSSLRRPDGHGCSGQGPQSHALISCKAHQSGESGRNRNSHLLLSRRGAVTRGSPASLVARSSLALWPQPQCPPRNLASPSVK